MRRVHVELHEEVFSCKVLACYESDIFPVSWLLLSFRTPMVLPIIRPLQLLSSLRMVVKVCNYMYRKTNSVLSMAHHTHRQSEEEKCHLLFVLQKKIAKLGGSFDRALNYALLHPSGYVKHNFTMHS